MFGLDDLTSTTTRSLDLDSLLGGQWGAGQSVSDSETDTQGLRHIKSQLEGLETMYSEVLKMLGARPNGGGGRMDGHLRNARRRQGSLSSLPSSSVSGRPIRDRRRNDERRKVRDIKVIALHAIIESFSHVSNISRESTNGFSAWNRTL